MFIYAPSDENIKITHGVASMPLRSKFERHIHKSHEMLLHINGDADYCIEGSRFTLHKYDLLLIPQSAYHFAIPQSNTPYENYVVNIEPDFADRAISEKVFAPPYIINIRDDVYLTEMFSMLDFFYEHYAPEDFAKASEMLIREILIYVSYKPKNSFNKSENDRITEITSYISNNLESELNAATIAEKMNFSSSYIQNLFSSVMGIGLMHYINKKKIYAAHGDIQNGLSANEAAEKYHYGNYSSFYRQYVKILGASPKNARRRTGK